MNNGAFGENFPYSDFHDMNTDWLVKIAKDFLDQYTHIQEVIANGEQSLTDLTENGLDQLQEKADTLENLLQTWYDTHSEDIANQLADALNDISNALQTAITDFGRRAEQKALQTLETIPDDYTALSQMVLNLKYAVDVKNVLSFYSKNNITHNGITYSWNNDGSCHVSGTATGLSFCSIVDTTPNSTEIKANTPYYVIYHANTVILQAYELNPSIVQTYFEAYNIETEKTFTPNRLIIRLAVPSGTTVDETVHPYVYDSFYPNSWLYENIDKYVVEPTGTNVDNMDTNGWHMLADTRTYTNNPFPEKASLVRTVKTGILTMQIAVSAKTSLVNPSIKIRNKIGTGTFSEWFQTTYNNLLAATETDANNCIDNGLYVFMSGNYTYYNTAYNGAHMMQVLTVNDTTYQIAYRWDAKEIKLRRGLNRVFTDWEILSGGNGNTYNFYNDTNTYNVTATPTIETENIAYLAPTGDNTDRTNDIITLLASYGICRLGPGDYYVHNISMPDGSSIIGMGYESHLILNTANTEDYVIQLGTNSCVENVHISGATNYNPEGNITNRDGIRFIGTATENGQTRYRTMINNIHIDNFSGSGIRCYDTGTSSVACLMAYNIYINKCNVGINISYFSEFNKFVNIRSGYNYYGIINNGGNNTFTECDVTGSIVGFVIDGTQPNSGHGTCINCIFNHMDNNTGTAIRINSNANGFLFIGCQIHYGKVIMSNSNGIVLNGCQFGSSNNGITIEGGRGIIFSNSIFATQPTITVLNNTTTRFTNCVLLTTGEDIDTN